MKIQNPFRLGLFGGLGVLVAIAIGVMVGNLATVITYTGAALFIALGLDPVVSWLEKHKFPRPVAIVTVLAAVVGVIVGLVFAIIPVISVQVSNAIDAVPQLIKGIEDNSIGQSLKETFPWLPFDDLSEELQKWVTGLDFATLGSGLLGVLVGILTGIAGALIVLILTLYFVSSLQTIKRALYRLIPASRRETFIDLSEQISKSVGRFVIGQASLGVINGSLSFIMLTLVFPAIGNLVNPDGGGWPISYSALLAFLAFLGSLVPLVGTLTSSALITVLVLLFDGTPSVFVVGIYYLIYMQVEAYVFTPRIMSSAVKVPGPVVVIAALAGGTLLGVLGALIAIPVAAAILLILKEVTEPRMNEL